MLYEVITASADAEAKRKQEEEARLAEADRKNLTRTGATWRSAVLPGWGQWKQGRKVQAIVYPSIIAVGTFFYIRQTPYVFKC